MDMLKKFFPYSFGTSTLTDLIIRIIVYVIAGAVAGVLIAIVAKLPIIGWIISILGGLVDLYVLIGIVVMVLSHMKILK